MFVELKSAIAIAKRKKSQSLLIGIIIMLISALLYIGISMISQANPFDEMYARSKAAETIMITDDIADNVEGILNWYNNRDEVDNAFAYKTSILDYEYQENGETQVNGAFITEYIPDNDYELLYIDEETIASVPKDGEAIINYNYSKSHGLKIGDTIVVKLASKSYTLMITQIAVDPQYSTPFMSPTRIFVAPDFFEKNGVDNTMAIIAIKYKDIKSVDDVWIYDEYIEEDSSGVIPMYVGYETIKSSYSIIQSVIASILIVVSLLIFVIVVFVIRSTVQNLILQQYKQIGVKKAIGYTDNQIRNSMLLVFSAIGLIASTFGSLIALPISAQIASSIGYDLQINVATSINIFLLINILVVIALIVFFTWIATKKATQVKPVQAIKYGMPEYKVGKTKFSISRSKRGPLGFLLAFKQLTINKKKSFMTLLLVVLLTYSAFTLANTGNTLSSSQHFASQLFGTNIGDCAFSPAEIGDIDEYIEMVEEIENVDSVIFSSVGLADSVETADGLSHAIGSFAVVGTMPNDFVILQSGKQPTESNEIVISTDIAELTKKGVGDYMTICGGDKETTYLVVGLYASITNGGYSYMVLADEEQDASLRANGIYWVYFESEGIDYLDVKDEILNVVGDDTVVEEFDSNISNVLSTLEAFPTVVSLLSIVLLVVAGIIIFNSTIMDINNSTKVYGIMKATGFNNNFITKMLVIRGLMITTMGITVGLIANILTMDALMIGVFKVTPFSSISMPVLFNLKGCMLLIIFFLVITVFATLIPSKRIDTISPKQLIAE